MERWDPFKHLKEEPTPQCLLRVTQDIAEFNAQPPARLFISPEESDITRVHVLMLGAPDTPYEGGFFQFFLKFPRDYPLRPPHVKFLNTDGGRVRFHVHLYSCGKVCMTTLGTGGGPCDWSPAQSLSSTLVSIQSLVSDKSHNDLIQYETIRVAVCDQVDAALREDANCPAAFRKVILESFIESYNKYEDAVKARLQQAGMRFMGIFGGCKSPQFELLLTRLQSLKDKVQKKKDAEAAGAGEAAAAESEN